MPDDVRCPVCARPLVEDRTSNLACIEGCWTDSLPFYRQVAGALTRHGRIRTSLETACHVLAQFGPEMQARIRVWSDQRGWVMTLGHSRKGAGA